MRPDNSTGLSVLGVVKWFLLVLSTPLLMMAWNGIVLRRADSSDGLTKLTGSAAAREGWMNLGYAGILWLAALGIWFFWQRNEE